jgi:hypothetical protein
LASGVTLTQGTNQTAPDPSSLLLSGYADGRSDVSGTVANGQNGLAYITF